jgi:hypothetical protein
MVSGWNVRIVVSVMAANGIEAQNIVALLAMAAASVGLVGTLARGRRDRKAQDAAMRARKRTFIKSDHNAMRPD